MSDRSSKLLSLVLLGTLAVTLAGFETESRAYRAMVEEYFGSGVAAGEHCKRMARKLGGHLSEHSDAIGATTSALATRIAEMKSAERDAAKRWWDDLWPELVAADGMETFGVCMNQGDEVPTQIEAFEAVAVAPIAQAFSSLPGASADEGSNLELAGLALETLVRTLGRYGEVVEEYKGDCAQLTTALDHWHQTYFQILDAPSQDLQEQIKRMTPEQFAAFAPGLQVLNKTRNITEVVEQCRSQLPDGDEKERLFFQTMYISVIVVNNLLTATP